MTPAPEFHPDTIPADEAATLPGLFRRRVEKTPAALAYRQYDPASGTWEGYTWERMGRLVGRWQCALTKENLTLGDRVAVLLRNSVEWVCFDQAALALGLVVVPLYTSDTPENVAYVLADSGAKLLLVGTAATWRELAPHRADFPALERVLCLDRDTPPASPQPSPARGEGVSLALFDLSGDTLRFVPDWLDGEDGPPAANAAAPHALATLVYTSGTVGRPKGVMLSHRNILWDAQAVLEVVPAYPEDVFLSFLPLSHSFERTVGYYLPVMAGCSVAFARSVQELGEDLAAVRPTVLIAVPRIFERVYGKMQRALEEKGALARKLFAWAQEIGWQRFEAAQGRGPGPSLPQRLAWPLLNRLVAKPVLARLGGRLRIAVSGGAPLYETISRCFVGMGLPLIQGYGLTEAAPVVSANRLEDNVPASVGKPLPGLEVRIGADDELLVRGPSVMLGYWNRSEETRQAIDGEGWLHTGDQARFDDDGRLFIRGRLKEILITSTGEKVPPADMEMAITQNPLFDMAMVVGEGKPCLAALLVLNEATWRGFAADLGLNPDDPTALKAPTAIEAMLKQVQHALRAFPGHTRVRAVHLTLEPWTIANGLMTPTLKLKRSEIEKRLAEPIRELYARHDLPE